MTLWINLSASVNFRRSLFFNIFNDLFDYLCCTRKKIILMNLRDYF